MSSDMARRRQERSTERSDKVDQVNESAIEVLVLFGVCYPVLKGATAKDARVL
jgi:hypothetical protein